MPKRPLTKAEKEKIKLTKQNFEDIIQYGARTIFEKALISFLFEVSCRRRAIELAKFEDIYWEDNEIKLLEKFNRPRRKGEEPSNEYKTRKDEKIKELMKNGEVIEVDYRGKKILAKSQLGDFQDRTKNLLLDLQLEYKTGYIFRKNKKSKYAIDGSNIYRTFNKCIDKANKRMEELRIAKSRQIINPVVPGDPIPVHWARHSLARNYLEENPDDLRTVQNKLGHASIVVTADLYGKQSISERKKKMRGFFNKDNQDN